ncbi:TPA: leucine-rich repeat domain-containing protein [Streptococcus suis]|nr:leucine-rich repeat domain-containing protein [Streptococcus suis]
MFVTEYSYESYFHFEVSGELPEEGILKGKEGELRFKRIQDGLAVYDSTLLNSGFVYPGSADDVYVPHTINDIPVTELHQTIHLKSRNPFTIENGNLKRVFIKIGKKSLEKQIKDADNGLVALLLYAFCVEDRNQKNSSVEVEFFFGGNSKQQVELCSIICDDKLVLHIPSAKAVEVNAYKAELRDDVPSCVEQITFSGKVYPFIEKGWNEDEPNNRCFEGLKNLRTVEGSLSGDIGWSFSNCTSLESIHLSDGIERVPSYAFSNCSSLKDLYIPDTVLEIGEYAFSGCVNLVSIHLPSHLKKISKGMFKDCKSLKKVYLSDTVEIIEDDAFVGCVSLRKPWIPKNIKHISATAFPVSEW